MNLPEGNVARRWLWLVLMVVAGCSAGGGSGTGGGGGNGGGVGTVGGGTGGGGGDDAGIDAGNTGRMNGQQCSTSDDCASRFCVDGVCCDTACEGVCQACSSSNTGEADGTCAPVRAATDPHDECDEESTASCGRNGTCDGQGACALHPAATECAPQTCTGATRTLAKTCDGQGTCTSNGSMACAPFACQGSACAGDCQNDSSCAAGQYCNVASGQCVPKKVPGSSCQATQANECASGVCADGVCCASACSGACEACTLAITGQPDGTCAPVPASSDPDGDCADQGSASCGTDGTCDGQRACRFYALDTPCAAPSCTGSTLQLADTCDGQGTCVDRGSSSCSPFVCGTSACKTSCAGDGDCASTHFCSNMTCTPKLTSGAGCVGNDQCASGFCVDGVCCSSSCIGLCQACSAAKKGQGSDGTCGAVSAGIDPDDECVTQAASTCGTDGTCDGSGACRLFSAGTVCAAASCVSGMQQNAGTCTGTGTCATSAPISCSPYVCGANACKASCAVDADCVSTHFCSGVSCQPRRSNGAACSAGNQCTSSNCVDGVCCNSACGGTCQACSTAKKGAGSDGTCGPIGAGRDPDNECADQGAPSCGTDGACSGTGACRLYIAGTICVAPSCASGTQQNADTCNGSGTCVDSGSAPCSPYVCGPNACKTSCASSADCAAGWYCGSTSTCVPKLAQGSSCTTADSCSTGFCVDGFCCNTSCTGLCKSCAGAYNITYTDGECGAIEAADPDNECSSTNICCNGICKSPGQCLL